MGLNDSQALEAAKSDGERGEQICKFVRRSLAGYLCPKPGSKPRVGAASKRALPFVSYSTNIAKLFMNTGGDWPGLHRVLISHEIEHLGPQVGAGLRRVLRRECPLSFGSG